MVDAEQSTWRDGEGHVLRRNVLEAGAMLAQVRTTRVFLATVHHDHDPTNNRPRNLAALCQRCHMLHDRDEHRRRRWHTLFQRRAIGDLFLGPYSTLPPRSRS